MAGLSIAVRALVPESWMDEFLRLQDHALNRLGDLAMMINDVLRFRLGVAQNLPVVEGLADIQQAVATGTWDGQVVENPQLIGGE